MRSETGKDVVGNVAMPDALPTPRPANTLKTLLLSLMPWGVSLTVHVTLLILSFCLIWSNQQHAERNESQIIPIAQFGVQPQASLTLQSPAARALTSRLPSPNATPNVLNNSTDDPLKIRPSVMPAPAELDMGGQSDSNTAAKKSAAANIGFGATNTGTGLDNTNTPGGKSNPFGSTAWAGPVLKASFYGNTGNARDIVYLVDASASLIDVLPFVLTELKRSVNELNEQQQFAVIFFQAEDTVEVPIYGLKPANPANKQKLAQWIDEKHLAPKGLSNPLKAVKQGLAYKPHLMFILSDNITGSGIEPRKLLTEIARANTAATHINTIQFLYPDKLEQSNLKPTLKAIAEMTGGLYKFLDSRELGIQ